MIDEIKSIEATKTGYCHDHIRKSDVKPQNLEREKQIIKKKFEDDKKRIQPVYNTKGKLITYDEEGKYVDIKK